MNIGKTLKESRISAKISVKEISDILVNKGFKASESTIYSWENENSQPTPGAFLAMCRAYGIKNVLTTFGYDGYKEDGSIQLNMKETIAIEKYRFVSEHSPDGTKIIDSVLDREYSIAEQISEQEKYMQNQQERIHELETENQEISQKITLLRIYTYFGRIASAGESFDFSEIPDETIEAPYMEGADFIIGVNGDSMEPDYHDGDRLYVKKTDRMTYGDVGIFTINNECFLKEYGKDGLISRNKDYNNMAGTEDVQLIGKVIGKV